MATKIPAAAKILKRLRKLETALEKDRDNLRDLEYDIGALADAATDAHESVAYAIERLSEHV